MCRLSTGHFKQVICFRDEILGGVFDAYLKWRSWYTDRYMEGEDRKKIDNLQTDLYSPDWKDVDPDERSGLSEEVLPDAATPSSGWATKSEETKKTARRKVLNFFDDDNNSHFFRRVVIGSVIFFVVALAIALVVFLVGLNGVSSKNVSIEVVTPVSVGSGEIPLTITVKNNNTKSPLENASLVVTYPPGTRSIDNTTSELGRQVYDIGNVSAGSSKEIRTSVVIFGERGAKKDFRLAVEYTIPNSNSPFIKEDIHTVTLDSSPVLFEAEHLADIVTNHEAEFKLTVASNTNMVLSNVLVQVEYPFGFEFSSGNPSPVAGKNIWKISSLNPREEKVITFKGIVTGLQNDERVFDIVVGVADGSDSNVVASDLVRSQRIIRVAEPPIATAIRVNGSNTVTPSVFIGNRIDVEIPWKNNTREQMENIEIKVALTRDIINPASFSVSNGGYYRSSDSTIVWDRNTTSSLRSAAPGDDGSVSFSFETIKESSQLYFVARNPQTDLGLTIAATKFIPGERSERVENKFSKTIAVRTRVTPIARTVYGVGPYINSGPMPLRADSSTTLTVFYEVRNTFNSVEGAEIVATVPQYVRVVEDTLPGNITYNPEGRELRWRVGNIAASAGYANEILRTAFQLQVTPSVTYVGTEPVILDNVLFTGRDTFAQYGIEIKMLDVTTNVSTDPSLGNKAGVVVR